MGDPFTEKVLIECCLELFDAGLVTGIQDLGGAGLACATSELASAGDGGMRIDLDAVPLRAQGMTPAEILCSESQERMCAVVRPADVDAFMAVCGKWEVIATVIGEVTDGDRLVITCGGQTVLDVPPRTVAHEGPIYHRPVQRPSAQDALQSSTPGRVGTAVHTGGPARHGAADGGQPRAVLAGVGDRPVRPLRPRRHRAGPTQRRRHGTHRRGHPARRGGGHRLQLPVLRPGSLRGAQLALAEAYRNVAVTGATPLAVTNCLNFGAPTDPGVMWQFEQAVRGLADGCVQLGIPVTGGNVSFYNQTGDTAILPTPVIGVLGVIDDVRQRIPTGVGGAGDEIWLLGETHDEFGGSQWAHEVHGHLGGRPPAVDLAREQAIGAVLDAASRDGLVSAAHDLSDGGLAQALVEACLSSGARRAVTILAR